MTSPLTCLVTGAGRGIGAQTARRLSAAGHRVALVARSVEQLESVAEQLPGEALVVPGDLSGPGAVDEVVDRVESAWGGVDVLVANAGRAGSAPIGRVSDEDWDATLLLNLTVPFRFVRRVAPGMKQRGFGRIVLMGSLLSKVGEPYVHAYAASKHGLLGLTRSVAAELARSGVTVNAVCPAYVDTEMAEFSARTIATTTGRPVEDARRYLAERQPIGRLVTVDEVASAVLYCVVNAAVTGQGLNVDGGAVQS